MALLTPQWDRACADCETYLYRDDGTISTKFGLPVLRPPGAPTPCHKCPKVPVAIRTSDLQTMRAAAFDLTPENRRAWCFYRRCRAVGRFPVDSIVSWTAAILRDVYDEAEGAPTERLTTAMVELTREIRRR